MSMTIAADARPESTTWASPVTGLWTSSRKGEYLGLVESTGAAFRATGARGEMLGTFDRLTAAKEAVALGGAA
jgi:hypothetical protein